MHLKLLEILNLENSTIDSRANIKGKDRKSIPEDNFVILDMLYFSGRKTS
jgi:hypothetical protein